MLAHDDEVLWHENFDLQSIKTPVNADVLNRLLLESNYHSGKREFLGGLSLHLNHLIASRAANYDWPFGTLPFGLFGSNLDTRDLETYPRTYSGHF